MEFIYIIILETSVKLGMYYAMMLVLLLFMHLLVADYCNFILYNVLYEYNLSRKKISACAC